MLSPNVMFKISELGRLLLLTFVGKIKLSKMKVAIAGCNFVHLHKFPVIFLKATVLLSSDSISNFLFSV